MQQLQRNALTIEFFSPRKILIYIFSVTIALVLLHAFGQWIRFGIGYDWLGSLDTIFKKGLIPLFNLEEEGNIPTLWSSFLAFFGALLSLVCTKQTQDIKKIRGYWFGLFLIFLFIAVDEVVGFHEMTMRPVRDALGASGLFYYAWIIPFGLLALVIGVIYLRFLFRIDKITRYLLILSGIIYLAGAVGLEIFEGQINEQGGYMNLSYVTLVTIEEFLEMSGLCLFIYAVMNYIKQSTEGIMIKICD